MRRRFRTFARARAKKPPYRGLYGCGVFALKTFLHGRLWWCNVFYERRIIRACYLHTAPVLISLPADDSLKKEALFSLAIQRRCTLTCSGRGCSFRYGVAWKYAFVNERISSILKPAPLRMIPWSHPRHQFYQTAVNALLPAAYCRRQQQLRASTLRLDAASISNEAVKILKYRHASCTVFSVLFGP